MGIERRINVINNLFPDGHWFYISTKENPADHASRPSTPQEILSSNWLEGPSFLWSPSFDPETSSISAPLPTILPEEELEVSILSTKVVKPSPFFFRNSVLFVNLLTFSNTFSSLPGFWIKSVRERDALRTPGLWKCPIWMLKMNSSNRFRLNVFLKKSRNLSLANHFQTPINCLTWLLM